MIGKYAFDSNELTSILIPKSVTLIDEFAFDQNTFDSIKFEPLSNIEIIAYAALVVMTIAFLVIQMKIQNTLIATTLFIIREIMYKHIVKLKLLYHINSYQKT